ncbi:hypothetical protein HHL16_04600 [Pseudoflavitalea sp. G-6-1-2]|uniref:hypothetical protein n=1 Tax=Pseudoflavitalea sp. G-6-1-2 TaxID=2728841 RepID=UPI00146CA22B|nr:hypothetical protein [Pseudoflavitalea sp. G-6-1-2]NML20137.1 hypothetical protein [Pseudoflavitalea sp. G-6-1-2]
MARSNGSIQTLYDLEKEIFKLQLKAKDIELKLDDSFDHLHDNFYKMGWNSVFSFRRRKRREEQEGSFSTGFVQGLLGTESIQLLLEKFLPIISAKISAGLEKLMERWFGKK